MLILVQVSMLNILILHIYKFLFGSFSYFIIWFRFLYIIKFIIQFNLYVYFSSFLLSFTCLGVLFDTPGTSYWCSLMCEIQDVLTIHISKHGEEPSDSLSDK